MLNASNGVRVDSPVRPARPVVRRLRRSGRVPAAFRRDRAPRQTAGSRRRAGEGAVDGGACRVAGRFRTGGAHGAMRASPPKFLACGARRSSEWATRFRPGLDSEGPRSSPGAPTTAAIVPTAPVRVDGTVAPRDFRVSMVRAGTGANMSVSSGLGLATGNGNFLNPAPGTRLTTSGAGPAAPEVGSSPQHARSPGDDFQPHPCGRNRRGSAESCTTFAHQRPRDSPEGQRFEHCGL